ncbi:hypothetical protein [Pontimicrobium sp. MEBiC06410]
MEEFLKYNYTLITHSVEIIAAVTGLLFYKKYKLTAAKYFIWFLVYINVCEGLAEYSNYVKNDGILSFLDGTLFEKNYWWSALYWKIGSILFFSFYYYNILKNYRHKLIIKYTSILFMLISLIYILFHFKDFFIRNLPIISVMGALVIILCSVLYFIQILQSERILTFYKSLNFYINSAILIWWLVITPLVFYDVYFGERDWDFVILKWQIYLFSNIFMYSVFTFGLIFSDAKND